ncbi:MAG TPA: PQQ-binding-like beta-propeller repeat protein [Verrucomicrobiales bacterium]|nr:PQQ-binding-like beta-propeller repeat protein [Verrucomicrobiales bacterium]
MKVRISLSLLAALGALAPVFLLAENWPEFRGPGAEGHAPDAKVPLLWSATKNIRWKVPVEGKGWSSPVVANENVFVTTAVVNGEDLTLEARCYQLSDGKEVWKQEILKKKAGAIHQKNSHASPTPVVAEGRVYLHFGHDGTACLNATDGKILWTQTSLSYSPVHGNGGSPVIFGDKLIFACDGQTDPFVVALNKEDGSVIWKTPRAVTVQRTFSFSTPLMIEVNGEKQAVIPGSGAVVSYNPATGAEIWRFRYAEGYSVVPRPLYRDGIIYVCSGFNRAILFAVKADGKGDVTDTHLVWQDDKAVPKESSPIIVDDLIYLNDDKGILNCFDAATGAEQYRERLDGKGGYSASPVYAGGHLFFHNGDGITTVIKPGKTFNKVAENAIGEFGLSSFAVVSDGFIVRTEGHLIRIGE